MKCEKFWVRCRTSSLKKQRLKNLSVFTVIEQFNPEIPLWIKSYWVLSCWCHSKRYTRSHCYYIFPGLLATIIASWNSVILDVIRKFQSNNESISLRPHVRSWGDQGFKKKEVIVELLSSYLDCVMKKYSAYFTVSSSWVLKRTHTALI